MNKLLIIYLLILFVSCSKKNSDALEQALQFAGDNRSELEYVLGHYSKYQEDSLKLRAAHFLMENMLHHYAYDSEKLMHYRNELLYTQKKYNVIEDEAIKILKNKYGELNVTKTDIVYDLKVITAGYLIKNIDDSFSVWENLGWKNKISFDDFCEEILPYRISTEPIEAWRENYYKTFQPVLDSLLVNKEDPVEACQILYDFIIQKDWVLYQKNPIPAMGANVLLNNRIGSCKDRADFMCYVMRSVGIPGGYDFFLQNPENNTGRHFWNFVKDTLGRTIEYTIYDQRPLDINQWATRKGRVYRQCFGKQAGSLPNFIEKKQNIPHALDNKLMKDVTSEYLSGYNLEILLDNQGNKEAQKYLYLALYNNVNLVPVTWSKIKNGSAIFRNILPDIVYFPGYYFDNKYYPVLTPILMKEDTIVHLHVKEGEIQEITVNRKYPKPRSVWYRERSIGGKFQGANNPDFTDATTLYNITTDQMDMDWHETEICASEQFKYLRYFSAPNGHCNIAEIEFISSEGKILLGDIIGTDGTYRNNTGRKKETVFDSDPLTFFDAEDANKGWVGLALETPEVIKKIRYIFRNDDNNVTVDNLYELFYWNNGIWNSLGKKTANSSELVYDDCPVGPLYILRNLTKGREERIFTYSDGKQFWW